MDFNLALEHEAREEELLKSVRMSEKKRENERKEGNDDYDDVGGEEEKKKGWEKEGDGV